jgi:hypothetical protein
MQFDNEFDDELDGQRYLRKTIIKLCEFIEKQKDLAEDDDAQELKEVLRDRAVEADKLKGAISALETL